MKEILSAKVTLSRELTMSDLFTLHQFAKSYSGLLVILSGDKLINPKHLPQLVSFFLLRKHDLMLVAEGHQVEKTLNKVQDWFKNKQSSLSANTLSLNPSI